MTQPMMSVKISLAILGISMLTGCEASKPTQFYTLSSFTQAGEQPSDEPIKLGVGPIYLPAYLDRPQVVTRAGANRMAVAEFEHWAEPLETTFQRVLAQNLSSRLATDHVVTLPARRDVPMDRQVEVEVIRFDADDAGQVTLDARWRIFDGRGNRMLDSGRSLIQDQAGTPGDYTEIAAAMSRCLATMTEAIADRLTAL